MTTWKHDDLLSDLTSHLRGYKGGLMIWEDMQLGPSGSARPDVYALAPTYTTIAATVYEIKISRSDFLSDVTSGKSQRYFPYCSAVVYAVPAGLVKRDEVPNGFGLIERHESGWRHTKKAPRHVLNELPQETWLKLLIDGLEREQGRLRKPKPRRSAEFLATRIANKVLGDEIGALFKDRERAKVLLTNEIEQLQRDRERNAKDRQDERDRARQRDEQDLSEARAELRKIAKELGIESPDVSAYQIKSALEALRPEGDREALKAAAKTLEWSAERAAREAADLRGRLGASA